MVFGKERMSSYVDRGNKLIAEGKTPEAMKLIERGLQHYSEKIVYLPDAYQPNDRQRPISQRNFMREELGLPPTGLVFCCFNTL